jgi:glutamyl-tRNA reductase
LNHLRVIGLNHHTAPVHVRERLAFNPDQVDSLLGLWRAFCPAGELVVVSTCNRVEIYTGGQAAPHEQMIRWLSQVCQVEPPEFQAQLFSRRGADVVRHLFSVASSLDSMIAGETQILGQVRDALAQSQQRGAAGAELLPLFQRAISVGRSVLSDGQITSGAQGVAGAAVAFARKVFGQVEGKQVLSIGAGKMGVMVLAGLSRLQPARLAVVSRDVDKAQSVANAYAGQGVSVGVGMDLLDDELRRADVVVSSTASKQPIVSKQLMQRLMQDRTNRPIVMVDIAVPRDIEHAAGEVPGVHLYDIDDLQREVERSMQSRQASLEQARVIVEREVDDFLSWNRSRQVGSTIDAMYARGYDIAGQELSRLLSTQPHLDESTRIEFEKAMRQTVNKLLHGAVVALKSSTASEPSQVQTDEFLSAVRKLFELETDTAQPDASHSSSSGQTNE